MSTTCVDPKKGRHHEKILDFCVSFFRKPKFIEEEYVDNEDMGNLATETFFHGRKAVSR